MLTRKTWIIKWVYRMRRFFSVGTNDLTPYTFARPANMRCRSGSYDVREKTVHEGVDGVVGLRRGGLQGGFVPDIGGGYQLVAAIFDQGGGRFDRGLEVEL